MITSSYSCVCDRERGRDTQTEREGGGEIQREIQREIHRERSRESEREKKSVRERIEARIGEGEDMREERERLTTAE